MIDKPQSRPENCWSFDKDLRGVTSSETFPFRPLFLGSCYVWSDRTIVRTTGVEVEISDSSALLPQLIEGCNGKTLYADIVRLVPPQKQADAEKILSVLYEEGMLVDSRNLSMALHHGGNNPAPFLDPPLSRNQLAEIGRSRRYSTQATHEATQVPDIELPGPLGRLLTMRSSAVSFPPCDWSASRDLAIDLAKFAYQSLSATHKPVPSAGRLWPLVIHALLPRSTGDHRDLILFHDETGETSLQQKVSIDRALIALGPSDWARAAFKQGAAALILSVDPPRVMRKYGNRGYRYALIEVGCATQTMYLRATEVGAKVRAFGGFLDDEMASLIEPAKRILPILALLIGR